MRRIVMAAFATVLATAVQAQPGPPRPPTAILYAQPNFQGPSYTVTAFQANLAGSFNDMAQSGRFPGKWTICPNSSFGGRCKDVSGDVADLATVGMGASISSLQAFVPGFQPTGQAWGWARGSGQPQQGFRHTLYPYPTVYGLDIASGGAGAYCRAMGHPRGADYSDTSQSAPRAIDGQGRYTGQTSVLRDVLCRD